ncbi:minor tail protein [Gordonia phage Bonum]|uniref:Minor tail protein n=2 Tax=Kablunavirus TaxID=2948776 RepID=A0A2D1GD03_9CAUD|nr:minor tail protein [Gordonia phage Kabluna]YP_010101167.1 minor tail protein [Gordonia phage NosilaM]ATN89564.1 minor tail protein [Gordonia phage Kabluna]QAU07286.1 minor tail protein [Gordonia phage NosilaM]QXN73348.1 minor tail protein [Gordonia phage Bonum]
MSGGLSRGDRTWVIFRGPEGGRFWLSGMRGQGKQGVELAMGLTGLDRPPTELVWLQEAHQNGADLVGSNVDVRTIKGAVNILGKTPRQVRAAYDDWQRNNFFERYSRLFFINSYSGVRFLDVLLGASPDGSLDKDPALLRRLAGYPWTWVSPNPYYKGYSETFRSKVVNGNSTIEMKVRNLGSAPRVYPRIYLPGPGTWHIPRGTRQPNWRGEEGLGPLVEDDMIPLPPLKSGEGVWLNPDTRIETITRVGPSGQEKNLWAQMNGQRPKLWLNPRSQETWKFRVQGGLPGTEAKMIVQPLYMTFW